MQPEAPGVASRRVLAPQRHDRVEVFLRVSVEIFDDQRPQRHFVRRWSAAGRELLSEGGEANANDGDNGQQQSRSVKHKGEPRYKHKEAKRNSRFASDIWIEITPDFTDCSAFAPLRPSFSPHRFSFAAPRIPCPHRLYSPRYQ